MRRNGINNPFHIPFDREKIVQSATTATQKAQLMRQSSQFSLPPIQNGIVVDGRILIADDALKNRPLTNYVRLFK